MLLALLFAVELAGGWSLHSPHSATTSMVAVAAGSHRRVFAVEFQNEVGSAIFRSDDGGSSWERLFEVSAPSYFLAMESDPNPSNADRLFVAARHLDDSGHTTRLYKSADGGTSWMPVQTHDRASTCSIAFDAVEPDTVYISYDDYAVYRSVDGGETFTGFPSPFSGALLASAPDGTLVAASGYWTWFSRDRGETWTATAQMPIPCPATALAVDPVDSGRWFVGSARALFSCGVVSRTDDGGATWALAAQVGFIGDLAVEPARPGLLYAGTLTVGPSRPVGRVLSTTDAGETWIDLQLPVSTGAWSLAVPGNGDRIYAATDAGLYVRNLRRPQAVSRPR